MNPGEKDKELNILAVKISIHLNCLVFMFCDFMLNLVYSENDFSNDHPCWIRHCGKLISKFLA